MRVGREYQPITDFQPAKKSVCIRVPLDLVNDIDLYSDWSDQNRTDSMIDLIESGLAWRRMTSKEFSRVWEDDHRNNS